MGVTGLWSFLRVNAPGSFEALSAEADMNGRRIAVDGGMLLTTALKITITDASRKEWVPCFVNSVMRRLSDVVGMGATPVIVLDGKAPTVKSHAHARRSAARERAEDKLRECRELGDKEGLLKALRASARMTRELECLATDAIIGAGLEVRRAPGEAEVTCAQMALSGEVWAVASEDGDTLVCGAPRVIRGVCTNYPSGPTLVRLGKILEELRLTPTQLRWMATLAGTDFHPGVPRVGCVRACKLIRAYVNPTVSLPELVADAGLHDGLLAAMRQFGDWKLPDKEECDEERCTPMVLNWEAVDNILKLYSPDPDRTVL